MLPADRVIFHSHMGGVEGGGHMEHT